MAHLTDLAVRRARTIRKPYTLKDGRGLYLNINPNGTKNWLFRFYWQGRQKRISFGTYPTIDLKKARSLRQQAHDQLINGIDPRWRNPRKPQKATPTETPLVDSILFSDYAQHWKTFKLKKLGAADCRQSTAIQIERYLRLDMLPLLGDLPLNTITRQHASAKSKDAVPYPSLKKSEAG